MVVFPVQLEEAYFRQADRAQEEPDRCSLILTCGVTDMDVGTRVSVEHP